jgi:hypothetical protein
MPWKKLTGENSAAFVDWEVTPIVEGEFVETQDAQGGNKSKIHHVKTADGDVAIWGSTVLDGRLHEVETGQKVKIEYLGLVKGKNGRDYKSFDVSVWVNQS